MPRTVRCQGAIVHEHQLLLIQHREHASGRSYWLLPGGGQEGAESEEDCVVREMREETGLEVLVERLLLDEPVLGGGVYQRRNTYLCLVVSGQAQPGYEPEEEVAREYSIVAVEWIDLRDSTRWDPKVMENRITLRQVGQVQAALGYAAATHGDTGQ